MGRKQAKAEKLTSKERTKKRIRKRIKGTKVKPRMSVYKSVLHTYVQLISDVEGRTLASASTLDKQIKPLIEKIVAEQEKEKGGKTHTSTKSCNAAKAVGLLLAERCREKGISEVVFDRNGCKYCGRVQAVAEGARAGGIQF